MNPLPADFSPCSSLGRHTAGSKSDAVLSMLGHYGAHYSLVLGEALACMQFKLFAKPRVSTAQPGKEAWIEPYLQGPIFCLTFFSHN